MIINREKFFQLRDELKKSASTIRELKASFKNAQRKELLPKVRELLCELWKIQLDCRHKHIAYALLKGRKYESVEQCTHRGNEPDWKFIQSIWDSCRSVQNERAS